MKETGILYTPDNHRLILSEEKTQTRRVIKHIEYGLPIDFYDGMFWFASGEAVSMNCPHGSIGDKLYVKEGVIVHASIPQLVGYYLDGCRVTEPWEVRRTAMFMPKWAARTWLEITDVRVELLQDISHEDAIAEGCKGYGWVSESPYIKGPHTDDGLLPQEEYRQLWDSINKRKYPWSSNPWVFAITFRRLDARVQS